MVFAEAGKAEDRARIQRNVTWLLDARVRNGGTFKGWTYGMGRSMRADNSNTQYAVSPHGMALENAMPSVYSRQYARTRQQVLGGLRRMPRRRIVSVSWTPGPRRPGEPRT
jgi:hypothetical protein